MKVSGPLSREGREVLEIEKNTVVSISPGIAYRNIDGHEIIINPSKNYIFKLNETGSSIWEMLYKKPVGEIASFVSEKYRVDMHTAVNDVIDFINRLADRGLVVVSKPHLDDRNQNGD